MILQLIINGDDLGMSRGITDAIVLAHRYGVLTSASLMTNMPAADYAISRIRKTPHLAVGVHLNICAGRPVLPAKKVPSLLDADGIFLSPEKMIRRLWLGRCAPAELEAEFCAQVQWAKDRGLEPTHVDSHHHMHIYPGAVIPFKRALEVHRIDCTRASQVSVWPKQRLPGGAHAGSAPRRLLADFYRRLLQSVVLSDFVTADSRISFGNRNREDDFGHRTAALASLPEGTLELVCHPGLFERGFSETDRIHAQRESEFAWLTSREVREAITERCIRLITYRQLRPEKSPSAASLHEATLP